MKQEFFFPIYQQIEREFTELSFYINIDRKQLKTYSIKIADLMLRTVSECENIASALCKKNKLKFKDKKGKIRTIVYFNEYIEKLNETFLLEKKLVSFTFSNAATDTFDCKQMPFRKDFTKKSNQEKTWSWYQAYNLIKHDRVKNYKQANLENLINAMAALFLLNVYFLERVFYKENEHSNNIDSIIKNIESFSEIFSVEYTFKTKFQKEYDQNIGDTFFNPARYFKIAIPYSTYLLEYDKEIKTSSDEGADFLDKLESSVLIHHGDGSITKKYEEYQLTDHKRVVPIVAYLNRNE